MAMTNSLKADEESYQSSFLEKLREYVFLSELLQEAWLRRHREIDILRCEVDSSGYDLVLQCGDTSRHIQLKSSRNGAKTARQTVNVKLADKPGGCIIWLIHDDSDGSVGLQYRFFGRGPKERLDLGDKVGKHSKGNAQGEKLSRPNTRVIGINKFDKPVRVDELFDKLFPNA